MTPPDQDPLATPPPDPSSTAFPPAPASEAPAAASEATAAAEPLPAPEPLAAAEPLPAAGPLAAAPLAGGERPVGSPPFGAPPAPPAPGASPAWFYGLDPNYAPPDPVDVRRQRRNVAIAGLAVLVAVSGLGFGVGWLWSVLAPRLPVIKADQGFLYASDEPEQPVAGDGYFLFIGVIVGIALAVLIWVLLRRYRGVVILVALAAGSLIGAVAAAWIGHKIGVAQFNAVRDSAPIGARLEAPLTLNMTSLNTSDLRHVKLNGVVAGQALAATFVYTALAGFSAYGDLGRRRRVAAPVTAAETVPDAAPGELPA